MRRVGWSNNRRSCYLVLAYLACAFTMAACGGGSSTHALPISRYVFGTTSRTLSGTSFRVTTVNLPDNANAEVVSVDAEGAVYFGSTQNGVPGFCLYADKCSTAGQGQIGTDGIYRYQGGSFTLTTPRGPYFESDPNGPTCNGIPAPNQYSCSVGNASAIDAADFSSVLWASDYSYYPDNELHTVQQARVGRIGVCENAAIRLQP